MPEQIRCSWVRLLAWGALTLVSLFACCPRTSADTGRPWHDSSLKTRQVRRLQKGKSVQPPIITVQQVEFQATTDSVWAVPAHASQTGISIALRITNRSRAPLTFYLFDTQTVSLVTEGGKPLTTGRSRYYTGGGQMYSPPIAPGQSFALSRAAVLHRQEDGTLRLIGDDGFGGSWFIAGLHPGQYRLVVQYQNRENKPGKSPAWIGEIQTVPCHVRIQ